MRAKSIMLLVLALGCGLVAAIGVTQVISQDSTDSSSNDEKVNILVAKQNIPARMKLTPEMIAVEAWPKTLVPEGALVDISQIEGMRAQSKIIVGDAIRKQKLFGKGDINTAAQHIGSKMRAVPIKIEQDSNAGLIQPGDRVDVLANLRKNTQQGIMNSQTIMLLQNVEVFAVDDLYEINRDGEEEKTISAKTVSLFLTPKQAVKVDLAQTYGKLRLVMRNPNDDSIIEGNMDISLDELLGTAKDVSDKSETKTVQEPTFIKPVVRYQPDTWKMRIISGPGINDLVLEEQDGNDGKKFWHVTTQEEGSSSTNPASSAPTSPASPTIDNSLVPPNLEPSGE